MTNRVEERLGLNESVVTAYVRATVEGSTSTVVLSEMRLNPFHHRGNTLAQPYAHGGNTQGHIPVLHHREQ